MGKRTLQSIADMVNAGSFLGRIVYRTSKSAVVGSACSAGVA